MGIYKIPSQNLSFTVPDDGEVFRSSNDPYSIFKRVGNQIITVGLGSLGTQYLQSQGGVPMTRTQAGLSGSGPTNVYKMPDGSVVQIDKGVLESYGEKALTAQGVANIPTKNYNLADAQVAFSFTPSTNITDFKPSQVTQGEVITKAVNPNNPNAGGAVTSNLTGMIKAADTNLGDPNAINPNVSGVKNLNAAYSYAPSTEDTAKGQQAAVNLASQEVGRLSSQITSTPSIFQSGGNSGNASTPSSPATVTQADIDKLTAEVTAEIKTNPITGTFVNAGNTPEAIAYAMQSGDISGLVNQNGQPFTPQEQQDAYNAADAELADYYEKQKAKDTADAESAMADKQRAFQESLITSGESFSKDKTTLDQNAADQGVLFSGSRVQKEQSLQNAYNRDQASKQANLASDIGGTARNYQSAYGAGAANNLSSMYQAGSNIYNPKVATGGVSSGGLSSIYNPGQNNFGLGTVAAERATIANQNAKKKLTNTANKLLSTGYNNPL